MTPASTTRRKGMRARTTGLMLATLATVVGTASPVVAAGADSDAAGAPAPTVADSPGCASGPVASFLYVTPRRTYWLRMTIEETVILGLGFLQYITTVPHSNFVLGWDWSTLLDKLTFRKINLDTNEFDSNQLAHPGAGALFYEAARANGFGVFGSSLATFVASWIWKSFGEFREYQTVNDQYTTTLAGIGIGESATQLGAFFDSGRSTPASNALSLVFAPFRKVHDWLDGAVPVRSENVDSLGLSRDVGHDFRLEAGAIGTQRSVGASYVDAYVLARSHLVNVAGYEDPGRSSQWLTDGNVSNLAAEGAVGAGGLEDAYLFAEMSPITWFLRDVRGEGRGRNGQRLLVGWTIGYDYTLHDYERRGGQPDRISTAHVAGLAVEHDLFIAPGRLRTGVALQGDFGGVTSLAATSYRARGGDPTFLPSVLREQGYYWGLGTTFAPAVELREPKFRVGASLRLQQYWGLYWLDAEPQNVHGRVSLHDISSIADVWVGVLPIDHLELGVDGRRRVRQGSVDVTAVTRDETSLLAGAAFLF